MTGGFIGMTLFSIEHYHIFTAVRAVTALVYDPRVPPRSRML